MKNHKFTWGGGYLNTALSTLSRIRRCAYEVHSTKYHQSGFGALFARKLQRSVQRMDKCLDCYQKRMLRIFCDAVLGLMVSDSIAIDFWRNPCIASRISAVRGKLLEFPSTGRSITGKAKFCLFSGYEECYICNRVTSCRKAVAA